MPRPPVAFSGAPSVAWSGREALLVGPGGDGTIVGAAYRPSRGAWRSLPPPPVTDRDGAVVEWLAPEGGGVAGGALIVWGGTDRSTGEALSDGAVYQPGGSWLPLPPGLSGRTGAASTVQGDGLVILGGTDHHGEHLRDGAVLLAGLGGGPGFAWEPVAAVPPEATPVAQVVWTGRRLLALSAPSPGSGEVRVHGLYPADQEWRPLPSFHAAGARAVVASAAGDRVVAWAAGGAGAGRLGWFDLWELRWRSVPVPLDASGDLGLALVGDDVVVWAGGASDGGDLGLVLVGDDVVVWAGGASDGGASNGSSPEDGSPATAARYEAGTRRWSELRTETDDAPPWLPVPPLWTGSELLLLHASTAWRPDGFLPALPDDTGAVVHVASRDELRSVALDELDVLSQDVALTVGYPSRLLLRGRVLLARRDGATVQAIPVAATGGDPEELDAAMALPAAGDGYWLLRGGAGWEAVAVHGAGTPAGEPVPLPDGGFPVAGHADGIVVAGPGELTRLWHPATGGVSWSVAANLDVVSGHHRLASCVPPEAVERGQHQACDALAIVNPGTGTEQRFADRRFEAFSLLDAAFAPDDEALAVPVYDDDGSEAVAIIGDLDGEPGLTALVRLDGHLEAPLAWHPGGRWLFAGVQQRLVAIDASTGERYETGVELPRPPYEMVVGTSSR